MSRSTAGARPNSGPYRVEDPLRLGFTVDDAKVNGRGFLHAGTIAAIADVAIGHTLAEMADPPSRSPSRRTSGAAADIPHGPACRQLLGPGMVRGSVFGE